MKHKRKQASHKIEASKRGAEAQKSKKGEKKKNPAK
jgi:hypothetical protein